MLYFLRTRCALNTHAADFNLTFGDALHPYVVHETQAYIKDTPLDSKPWDVLSVEVCSRKVYETVDGTPLSAHYRDLHGGALACSLTVLTNADVARDLDAIRAMAEAELDITHLVIFPHVDLRQAHTGDYIAARHELRLALQQYGALHPRTVMVVDFERVFPDKTLEQVLSDGTHWSNQALLDAAKAGALEQIQQWWHTTASPISPTE
jgi:hypothetical protein